MKPTESKAAVLSISEVDTKSSTLKSAAPATESTEQAHEENEKPPAVSASVQQEPQQQKESACSGGVDPFAGKNPTISVPSTRCIY